MIFADHWADSKHLGHARNLVEEKYIKTTVNTQIKLWKHEDKLAEKAKT
jgi:hypothetical protein